MGLAPFWEETAKSLLPASLSLYGDTVRRQTFERHAKSPHQILNLLLFTSHLVYGILLRYPDGPTGQLVCFRASGIAGAQRGCPQVAHLAVGGASSVLAAYVALSAIMAPLCGPCANLGLPEGRHWPTSTN